MLWDYIYDLSLKFLQEAKLLQNNRSQPMITRPEEGLLSFPNHHFAQRPCAGHFCSTLNCLFCYFCNSAGAAIELAQFVKRFKIFQDERLYINVKYYQISKLSSKHFIDSMPHKILGQLEQIDLDWSPIARIKSWLKACKQGIMINSSSYRYSNSPVSKECRSSIFSLVSNWPRPLGQ